MQSQPDIVADCRHFELGDAPVEKVLDELRQRLKRGEQHLPREKSPHQAAASHSAGRTGFIYPPASVKTLPGIDITLPAFFIGFGKCKT